MSMPDRLSSPFTRQEYGIPKTTLREVRPETRPVDLDATLPLAPRRPAVMQFLTMRCLCCQGIVERSTAPVKVERGRCRLEWDSVPAWVCTRCGQTYFEQHEVERITKAARAVGTVER